MVEQSGSPASTPVVQEARYEASGSFPQILDALGISLLVSTYQAGKLLVLGTFQGNLEVAFHSFEKVMGVAVRPDRIAVGARGQIFFLESTPELAPRVSPPGKFDACFLTRSSHVTGEIHGHDLAWSGNDLWVVNTLFSCLCTLDPQYSFVPRWQPPFVSNLAPEDRCHLNGLALENGKPRYVTLMAESDTPGGWRPTKATSGCVMDVASSEVVARGFAMPHSPRIARNQLFVLDSGHGRLSHVDRQTGHVNPIVELPGYTRGLSFAGNYAFVGLSKIRETSVFGGIPIAADRENLRCGIAVVDMRTGELAASFLFHSGVTELFAVEVIAGVRCPATTGPRTSEEEGAPIWFAPGPVPLNRDRDTSEESIENLVARGDGFRQQAAWDAAASCYRQALQLRPMMPEVASNLGLVLHEAGRLNEALGVYEEAVRLFPDHVLTLLRYGNLLRDAPQRVEDAKSQYTKALQIEPENAFLHANLAQLVSEEGDIDQAQTHFSRSVRLDPVPAIEIASAVMLPPIYRSMTDLMERREKLVSNLADLHKRGVTMDPTRDIVPHLFYPVYQGQNDRELHREFAKLYRAQVPDDIPNYRPRGRIRVGILSRFFCNHTIGMLNRGLVEKLDRKKFHVTVLSAAFATDETARAFQQHADNYVVIPEHVPAARQQIADLGLDILLYADIGMSAFTFSLAFTRLAPIQCVTWGHPQTTGIPTLDYFLSGEHLESAQSDDAYTESLVRLRGLQTYYSRPSIKGTRHDRDHFGLPANAHLYGCPQSLFKFHPEFDAVLAEILRRDPDGLLVLLNGKFPQWNQLLLDRWSDTMPDVLGQIRFLPRLSKDEFLSLNTLFDVALDPLHFGGGNTSFEALSLGTPVVTLPSAFLRGRITNAQYQMMGLSDCIASTPEDYVELALKLGVDRSERQGASTRILETCPVLFQNEDNILALEEFFESVVNGA
ncbi:MAG: TIGR03032 family protein [Planctomycetaceae bacterium]|nr:TIGR03032 family protein [Planctomycetaceae bacterium]